MGVRSLSPLEARVILSLEAEGIELVSLDEIRRRGSISAGFARKLAYQLVRKRWLQRVRQGMYLLNPSQHGPDAIPDTDPLRLGSRFVQPYYFGYATAAELLGLLPQASKLYYLVSTARAVPVQALQDRFRLIRVTPSRFFGFQRMERRGTTLSVSNLERTVLDCLNRPELAGGMAGISHIMALAKPRLNWGRFGRYLNQFGNRNLALRAGFLAERVRPSIRAPASWIRPRLARPHEPFAPLGPASVYGRSGPRDERWHVIDNVPDAVLFAEGEIP